MKETPADARPLLILGTRSFAEEAADVVSEIPGWYVDAFVENEDRQKVGTEMLGRPVLWVDDLMGLVNTHYAFCALSTVHRARFTNQVESIGVPFATLVHPSAQVSRRARLGDGAFVSRGSIIATQTQLGKHCIINRGVTIGHHTTIGDHCTIQPGANVAGLCAIDDSVFIGMGANVIDRRTIGRKAVIGAGALVVKDVPERTLSLGVPAKVVQEDVDGK